MSKVAVIGLGGMGSRIARRLIEAGHEVWVWNRTVEKTSPLTELGAMAAETPADAARRADVVITMVADAAALEAVTEGPTAIAAGLGGSTTVIEMSTVGPAAIERLAAILPDGTPLIDAPVLGSLSEVEAGTLKIFIGGPLEVLERWRPLLITLGSPIHVGDLGSGASAKLVANLTLLGTLGLLGEALALADGLGISRAATYAVLAHTPLGPHMERRRAAIDTGDYPLRFSLALAHKDAALIAAAAAAVGVDTRIVAAAQSWFADAEAAGWGEHDYSAVLAYVMSPGESTPRSV